MSEKLHVNQSQALQTLVAIVILCSISFAAWHLLRSSQNEEIPNKLRAPAADSDRSMPFLSVEPGRTESDLAEVARLTGITAVRAREVRFNRAALLDTTSRSTGEFTLRLNLFDDGNRGTAVAPIAVLRLASSLDVNSGIYTGRLLGKEESSVRLMVDDSGATGQIESEGHLYEIVNAGSGRLFIIERKTLRN